MKEHMKFWFKVIRKYAVFKGRACRKEFWSFFVFLLLCIGILLLLDTILGLSFFFGILGPLSISFAVLTLIPALAVTVRRLHDVNRSGWWLLLEVVPLINVIFGIVLLIWLIRDGSSGENNYGPNPKEMSGC